MGSREGLKGARGSDWSLEIEITKICTHDAVPVDGSHRNRICILLEEIRHQAQTCGLGLNTTWLR